MLAERLAWGRVWETTQFVWLGERPSCHTSELSWRKVSGGIDREN